MTDLNLQIVREFFELQLFHVLSYWGHEDAPARLSDPAAMLFVEQLRAQPRRELDFLLRAGDAAHLERAVVEIRAWHADRFYASVIESSTVLGHVASAETQALAGTVFDGRPYCTVLVISELPQGRQQRARAVQCLQEYGMNHIIEFPTILQEMLARINAYGNYAPSSTLQTLRLLKRYHLVRRQQLEFPFTQELPPSPPPAVEVQIPPDPIEAEAEEEEEENRV